MVVTGVVRAAPALRTAGCVTLSSRSGTALPLGKWPIKPQMLNLTCARWHCALLRTFKPQFQQNAELIFYPLLPNFRKSVAFWRFSSW